MLELSYIFLGKTIKIPPVLSSLIISYFLSGLRRLVIRPRSKSYGVNCRLPSLEYGFEPFYRTDNPRPNGHSPIPNEIWSQAKLRLPCHSSRLHLFLSYSMFKFNTILRLSQQIRIRYVIYTIVTTLALPSSIIMVCSKCADKDKSFVEIVQLSFSSLTL
jgi:hypothetical protein